MVYLRARWYNTSNGTFTSRDSFPGFPEQPYSQHPYQYGYSDPVLLTDPTGQWVDDPSSSLARACGQLHWPMQRGLSGCSSPYQADPLLIEGVKQWHGPKPFLDKPCIPYVEFEMVFEDGTRLCVLNLNGMQFGVLLDPALLLLIEQSPTCLQPVFTVQSNGRIVLRNEEEGENALPPDEESPPPSHSGPPAPPGTGGPPRTPRGTRLDRLGVDGDEIVNAAEARADVAKNVAEYELELADGIEGRTFLEKLRKTHLRSQKIFILQIEGQGGFSYAQKGKILELIETNQTIEALNIVLGR
jgi:hypothetical protein